MKRVYLFGKNSLFFLRTLVAIKHVRTKRVTVFIHTKTTHHLSAKCHTGNIIGRYQFEKCLRGIYNRFPPMERILFRPIAGSVICRVCGCT